MRNLAWYVAIGLVLGGGALVQAEAPKLPDGPGKEPTERICGSCHGAELVIGRQESRESWGAIVSEMIQRGATGTDQEFETIVDYLATNFSKTSPAVKLNVNKATPGDLVKAMQISEKDAAAIVQQRDEKGEFKSIEELEKVPGVDVGKIEASKNRLSF